jgi:hypothetical protein
MWFSWRLLVVNVSVHRTEVLWKEDLMLAMKPNIHDSSGFIVARQAAKIPVPSSRIVANPSLDTQSSVMSN